MTSRNLSLSLSLYAHTHTQRTDSKLSTPTQTYPPSPHHSPTGPPNVPFSFSFRY